MRPFTEKLISVAADLRLLRLESEVVTVERDVERAHGRLHRLDGRDLLRDALGEGFSAGLDADQRELVDALRLLDDLVGDAGEGPIERDLVEDLRLLPVRHGGQKKSPSRGLAQVGRASGCFFACVMTTLLAGLAGPA